MSNNNKTDMLLPGDLSFLALLVAPDVQPFMVKPDVELRLTEAGYVMRLHGALRPTPAGVVAVEALANSLISDRRKAAPGDFAAPLKPPPFKSSSSAHQRRR